MDESRTAGFSKVLEGKNALVLGGGGGGIGRAITRGLAAAGGAVGVADVDQQRADEAAAEAAAESRDAEGDFGPLPRASLSST